MASIFWDSQVVIIMDYLEHVRTINGTYYAEELRRLSQEIEKKRSGKLTLNVLLLQDNAPAFSLRKYIQQYTIIISVGSECPDQTASMRVLIWASAVWICPKRHFHMPRQLKCIKHLTPLD